MPKHTPPQRNTEDTNNLMKKNQFEFKLTRPLTNLDKDPSIKKHQFYLKFDKKTKELADAEPVPVNKLSKQSSSRAKSKVTPTTTTIQHFYITNHYHGCSPVSAVSPNHSTHTNMSTFFTTPQDTNHASSSQTTNMGTFATNNINPTAVPSMNAEKIKISNLVNKEKVDEKELNTSVISALAEAFKVPMKTLEAELATARLW